RTAINANHGAERTKQPVEGPQFETRSQSHLPSCRPRDKVSAGNESPPQRDASSGGQTADRVRSR
ncbi:MAG: hypothetical protein OET79_14880, partial [Nitrospirota bacterium]|nr:hypothetical protein [Nitrospirota bacterium]